MERETRLELATSTLARWCSTNWAIPALFALRQTGRNSNEVRLGVKPNHAYRLNYLQSSPKNSLIGQKKQKYRLAIYLPWEIIRVQLTTTKGGDQWYLLQVSRDNLLSCSSHTSNEGRFLTGPFYLGDTFKVLKSGVIGIGESETGELESLRTTLWEPLFRESYLKRVTWRVFAISVIPNASVIRFYPVRRTLCRHTYHQSQQA